MKNPALIALLTTFLLLYGCDSSTKGVSGGVFSKDSSVAYQQVQAKFPKGVSEAEVLKIMDGFGAEVSRLESEGAINHMVVGTISEGDAQWMIGVSIMDGVVTGHSVNITSK
jgi:hypothetical protein